jgi:GNAT superfamily N-acetyltransferase
MPRQRSTRNIGKSMSTAEAAQYSARETLAAGRVVEIRALRPEDRANFVAAAGRSSAESLYTRFFSRKRSFTEDEVDFFTNIDFVNHVALVAVLEEGGQPVIVGGGRYIVVTPEEAEMAFTVIDQYQGQGVGKRLLWHLVVIARAAGLKRLVADVLAGNASMLKVFTSSGLPVTATREAGVVHITLALH